MEKNNAWKPTLISFAGAAPTSPTELEPDSVLQIYSMTTTAGKPKKVPASTARWALHVVEKKLVLPKAPKRRLNKS